MRICGARGSQCVRECDQCLVVEIGAYKDAEGKTRFKDAGSVVQDTYLEGGRTIRHHR